MVPNIFRYLDKRFDHVRIKLPATPAHDFFTRRLVTLRRSIDAVYRHRVQRIGYRKDSRSQGNFLTLQSTGISGPVVALLMGVDDFACVHQKRDLLNNLITLKA